MPQRALWPTCIGTIMVCYALFDYAVLHHAGTAFYPYATIGLERTHVAALGSALIFIGYVFTPAGGRRLALIFSQFGWQGATLLVLAFASLKFFAETIRLNPFESSQWQEYTGFIVGRRPENIGAHPLFQTDVYLPPLYLLPFDILKAPVVQIAAVVLCWVTPLIAMLHTLRKLGFDALTAAFVVMFASYLGQAWLQLYMLAPNPFYYYGAIDFRMTVIPCLALMAYCMAARRWLLAGLFAGLTVVSHIKFGLRAWVLVTILMTAFIVARRWRRQGLQLGTFIRFQAGFSIILAPTLFSVMRALHAVAQLQGPRAAELISPLGWLIKNEPDDWLLLYQPANFLTGIVLLAIAAILLCLWLGRRGSDETYRRLAWIGALSSAFALVMLAVETCFELWGLSVLPWSVSLALLLDRPWEFLWVAPLALGIMGGALLFNHRPRGVVAYAILALILGGYFGKQLQRIATSAQGFHPLVTERLAPAAALDYSVLTICSLHADEHARAKAEAIASLLQADAPHFEQAVARMQAIYRNSVGGNSSIPRIDLEAENLLAIAAMRAGKYAAAYAGLRAQDDEIHRLTPSEHPWSGDVQWVCDRDAKADTVRWETVLLPWPDLDEALVWIARHAPAGVGVIQPPSLSYVTSESKHAALWQTKFDSHAMYLYVDFYRLGLNRLNLVAGPGALEFSPGFRYGDPGEAGRRFFRALQPNDFSEIQRQYPAFRLILTEATQHLDLPLLFSNRTFTVYRCCSRAD